MKNDDDSKAKQEIIEIVKGAINGYEDLANRDCIFGAAFHGKIPDKYMQAWTLVLFYYQTLRAIKAEKALEEKCKNTTH